MKTAKEILLSAISDKTEYVANTNTTNSQILLAMEEYAKGKAISFHNWVMERPSNLNTLELYNFFDSESSIEPLLKENKDLKDQIYRTDISQKHS